MTELDTINDLIINAQQEYIVLLGKEINSLLGVAMIHGWESKLADEGLKANYKIQIYKALKDKELNSSVKGIKQTLGQKLKEKYNG